MISSENDWSIDLPASLEQLIVPSLVVELLVGNSVWLVVADVSEEILVEVHASLVDTSLSLPLTAHTKHRPVLSKLIHPLFVIILLI